MTIHVYRTTFSVYEVDEANMQVRRVRGQNPPTPSQAADGEWQKYRQYEKYGDGLIFYWPSNKATITSPIKSTELIGDAGAAPTAVSSD